MRKTLLSALAVVVLLCTSSTCPAQPSPGEDQRPVLTVSISGYNALTEDLDYIGKLADNPGLGQMLEASLTLFTQGQGLAGLDKAKPWGAVLNMGQPDPWALCVFVPVTDLQQLLTVLAPMIGEAKDAGNGVFKVQKDGPPEGMMPLAIPPLYIKEANGYALVAMSAETLANAPADPLKALGGLNERYDVAVRASIQSIPAPMRQTALETLKMGAEMGMRQMPDEGDEEYAIRTGIAKRGIQQFITMANDLDEVLLGWTLDGSTGSSHLDFEITAVAGSKTAAQFAEMKEGTTNFAGFDLPGAAISGNWTGTLSDSDVAQAKDSISQIRTTAIKELGNEGLSDQQRKLATQLLEDLFYVLEKTLENKEADGGIVVLLGGPGDVTAVAGGLVVETAKLDSVIQQLAGELTKEEPAFAQLLKLGAETHKGIRFHTLDVPVEDEEGAKVFGDTLHIVAGLGDKEAYLAVGSKAAETLKQVIDKSKADPGKSVPPMRLVVTTTPILKFVAAVAEEGDLGTAMAAKLAEELAKAGGKDRVILTVKPIPNGSSTRLEFEEGVLKMFGMGVKQGMQQGMQGPGMPGGAMPADDDPF
ncbi:MAG: hypothetical protein A2V70_07815 [Planctomycetes bacterium RBG_13_63_9]|nr:MAG: hypothetical protein A2V70_07815 [Planctomycetes bacterium RBG_13_63_9]